MAVREQVYGFFIPSVTLIGIGAAKQIPEKIKALGASKPLVVTDKGITQAGIAKKITSLLDAAKMKYVVYDETIPNPTDKNVHDGVEVYKKNKCDSLISLGGGSSHDCGKGIGLVIANGGIFGRAPLFNVDTSAVQAVGKGKKLASLPAALFRALVPKHKSS